MSCANRNGFQLIRWILVMLAIALVSTARAEVTPPVIEVSGLAERLVRPDLAHFEITIDVRDEKLDSARREAGARTIAVLRSLKEIGITDDMIDSGSLAVQPEFAWEPKSGVRRLQGYFVARTIRVRLLDLEKLGVILERTVKSGANQIAPPRFGLQSESQVRRELLSEATRDARQNAAAIAAGFDAKLGSALRVDAIETDMALVTSPMMLRASAAPTEDTPAEQSYRAGDITLRAQVKARFAIAP